MSAESAAKAVELMGAYLEQQLASEPKKLWENTFICHQLDKRAGGGAFTVAEHLRGMVYSMLSAGIVWERVKDHIDAATGQMTKVDGAFHDFDPDALLQDDSEQLRDEVKRLGCASQYTMKQMTALVKVNIPKLLSWQKRYGSIDGFYREADTLTALVKRLSDPSSPQKLSQMGEALTAEYLKNVGYDLAKPDRHLRRILGSETVDMFNSYRRVFREYADTYSAAGRAEYDKRVRDLTTFLEFFPKIYDKYLDALADRAMEILVSEGIWTVSKESFVETHTQKYGSAINDYQITLKSIELTVQNNARQVSKVTSFIPQFTGGGFGLKGALKGAAKAEAFNFARDHVEASLIGSVSQVNQQQQAELFGRINPDSLFIHVFNDYWSMLFSVYDVFAANGKSVWLPTNDQEVKAKNIFANLSNPSFPQAKKLEAFISILTMYPYNKEFMKYMINVYGNTDETRTIKDYFGYYNFDDPKLGK